MTLWAVTRPTYAQRTMFRIQGVYAGLILHQQRAAVSIDLRLLDWSLTDPAAKAADRAALEYETKLNPQPSKLLEKLLDGQPVMVSWRALPHVADPPGGCRTRESHPMFASGPMISSPRRMGRRIKPPR